MGLYSKISSSAVSKSGSYFSEGNYKVEILRVKEQESSTDNRIFFIIETKVLESDNPDIKVGGERSQVIDLTQVMGLPNVKQFIASVSGVDTAECGNDEINERVEAYWTNLLGTEVSFEQICEMVTSEDNVLDGLVLDLMCVEITTKANKPFTKHRWLPVSVEGAEAGAA